MSDSKPIPTHLGFILDGNRRWARSQGLPTIEGHRRGYDNLKKIASEAFDKGVQYVSAYIFSAENWNRAEDEVSYLMKLALKIATQDAKEYIKNNIRIVALGRKERVPEAVYEALKKAEADSQHNTGGTLVLCFNYGGHNEVVDAVKRIVESGISSEEIDTQLVSDNMYHPDIPAIDMMVRTSGEQRLSGFMLWRIAYAELFFTQKHWPEFGVDDLAEVLESYGSRSRRFGGN
jgi:undecaprenyl diphosphate synthase